MSLGRDEIHGGQDATFVTQLQPNDVLMGRGAPITDSIGNRRFLSLVREKCVGYQQAATRKEKDAIARQIVSTIHARSGLFLRKIESPEEATQLGVPEEVVAWTAANEKTVLLKIKQALRDRSLEGRDQTGSSPQDFTEEATEVPSQCHDEELGTDEMVAVGLATQDPAQQPRAKRAKTQSLIQDDPTSRRDVFSQAPAPGLAMSAPAQLPNFNRFQGGPGSILNLQLPLHSHFSQAPYHPGTLGYYAQLPIAAQIPSAPAGMNLKRAISINLQPAAGGDGGNLLGDLNRQTNFANRTAHLQVNNEGEMKTNDEKRQQGSKEQALDKETSGEIALRIACDVCETGRGAFSGSVKLDPIELCVLSVLSSRGFPTWSSTNFRDGNIISAASTTAGSDTTTSFLLTWTDIGNELVQEVHGFLSSQTSKLFPHDAASAMRGSAVEGFVSRLVSMAVAYSKDPTSLARMAIMLLEKLRRHSQIAPLLPLAAAAGATPASTSSIPAMPSFGRSVSASSKAPAMTSFERSVSLSDRGFAGAMATATTSRTTSPSGEFVFQGFLTSELRRWATSLNVADEVGFPVPFSSNDEFAVNFPQYRQTDTFSTASILDALGCRAILHQATFLTRLRSLLQTNPSDRVLSIIRSSVTSPATRTWGISFVESAVLDMSLIKALLANGFSGLMKESSSNNSNNNTDDALLRTLMRHTSVTKADVEKQVVQLTCLLHRHFQSKKINQVMSQQASKLVEMMGR